MIDIRLLVLDVDGVLTDGSIHTHADGSSSRIFHVQDGFAIRWFQELAGPVVICSGKDVPAVDARAEELRIDRVIQGSRDKVADLDGVLKSLGVTWAQTAVIGDDLPDLGMMRACGFPIAVANATAEARAAAMYVTQQPGGRGAVREAIELILRRAGRWDEVVSHYAGQSAGAVSNKESDRI